jgi:hypothetical protein
LCLSFQAVKVSGQTQARRRGRVYIGGLGIVTTAGTTNSFPVPTGQVVTNLVNAAQNLGNDAPDANWSWVVYSRANDIVVNVDNGWVDNAFDTQRRRGNAPSQRETFELA